MSPWLMLSAEAVLIVLWVLVHTDDPHIAIGGAMFGAGAFAAGIATGIRMQGRR